MNLKNRFILRWSYLSRSLQSEASQLHKKILDQIRRSFEIAAPTNEFLEILTKKKIFFLYCVSGVMADRIMTGRGHCDT